jgi:2-polyprenyl-3-methyl-5-hydroxy-6-metoxy-1,4-benzoquinol methylase
MLTTPSPGQNLMNDPRVEQRFLNTSRSRTLRNIVRLYDLDKRPVLDIGCSFGEFLALFGKGSTGITIAREEVDYGKQKGLDVRYGNIEEDDLALERQYEVLFCNNLFEHLLSPHMFLCRIEKHVTPNGLLILGVPVIPKIVSLLPLNKFRGSLAEAHISFFTRDTLVRTVERAGWRPISTRGFHFAGRLIDGLFTSVYPHLYVVAVLDPDFKYTEKRMRELAGYTDVIP